MSQRIFKKSRKRPVNKQTMPIVRKIGSLVTDIKLIPTIINRIETAYKKAAKENEMINSKISIVTEQGDVEKWDGSGKEQLLKQKEEALEYLKSLKK